MPGEVTHMSDRREISWWSKISPLMSVLAQSVVLIVFIARMDARITMLEERRQEDKTALTSIYLLKEKVVLTEAQVQALMKSVDRMELKLDQQRALEDTKRAK